MTSPAKQKSIHDVPTPALVIDMEDLQHNLDRMREARPGASLRPHVKAHKSTALARLQAESGHRALCCSTVPEVLGLSAAGLGEDLLLANEVLDTSRLAGVEARLTVAVDSEETILAAGAAGIREVLIDVNVGLRRCGCEPASAPHLADLARSKGLGVRGVMGYEGPCFDVVDRSAYVEQAMALLITAHDAVGGEVMSAGGTATYDVNHWATELQAGTYLLMDVAHTRFGFPFRCALSVLSTVISKSRRGWVVCDAGVKAQEMGYGGPSVPGSTVVSGSDEHLVFTRSGAGDCDLGSRIRIVPGDSPVTMSRHSVAYLTRGDEIEERIGIDLRGW